MAVVTCLSCQARNLPEAKFCDHCGQVLTPAAPQQDKSWLFGSAPDCDVVVPQRTVSAHHCRLSAIPDGFRIEDVGSTNGTFVNGHKIQAAVRVTPFDAITLGRNVALPWPTVGPQASPKVEQSPQNGAKENFIRIGRDTDNDVVLDYPMVSGHHARIVLSGAGATIEDLSSRNGVAIGSPDRKISRSSLLPQDTVYFGSLPMPASRLLQKVSSGEKPHTSLVFSGQTMTLGRDPQSELVLDHPMISWRHARLTRSADNFIVEDLGSTNGTFVNGNRISGAVSVKPGDRIGLGSYTFVFTASGRVEQRDYRGNATIEAKNVTVDVPGKRLLEDASLTVYPSEIVGLMGPAGAGKTTLITALNGYSRPSSGTVLINGQDLYRNYDQFRGHIGYVPQDDIMHADLTVGQALYYTARLRLPSDYRRADIKARVEQVITLLELDGTEEVIIGSPDKKGISGGQRKRVNLAMELLSDPPILFLDEPTSGLAATDALMVMKVLRKLADQGKTIIITIHQPGREVFRKMDSLIIVSRDKHSANPGKVAYFGPAYPDSILFFNSDTPSRGLGPEWSPDDALSGLEKKSTAEWISVYKTSRYKREYVDERAGRLPDRSAEPMAAKTTRQPGLAQWWTLVQRNTAIKVKDKSNTAILLALAPLIGAFVVFTLGLQAATEHVGQFCIANRSLDHVCAAPYLKSAYTIFFIIISALFLGCWNALKEIVGERAIYRRERMVNLKIPSYVASKFTVLGGLLVFVQCPILLAIVYAGASLQGYFPYMLGVTILTALVALAMGLSISATVRTSETGTSVAILIMIVMILMAGAIVHPHEMGGAARFIANFVASRWGFEALLLQDSAGRPSWTTGSEHNSMANPFFPADQQVGPATSILILFLMLIALMGGTIAILKAKDKH
jgi:ABC transport system ATP-binding/permease protein